MTPKLCTECGIILPTNGHATGGVQCLQRQLAAARAELATAQACADAAAEYLKAHAALAAAGVTPERPAAAQQLADAWIALGAAIEANNAR